MKIEIMFFYPCLAGSLVNPFITGAPGAYLLFLIGVWFTITVIYNMIDILYFEKEKTPLSVWLVNIIIPLILVFSFFYKNALEAKAYLVIFVTLIISIISGYFIFKKKLEQEDNLQKTDTEFKKYLDKKNKL